MKNLLVLSVCHSAISDKANTAVGFLPCLGIVRHFAQFYKKFCVWNNIYTANQCSWFFTNIALVDTWLWNAVKLELQFL
jgi:hypothetical protein